MYLNRRLLISSGLAACLSGSLTSNAFAQPRSSDFIIQKGFSDTLQDKLFSWSPVGLRLLSFTASGGFVLIDNNNRRFARNIPDQCYNQIVKFQNAGHQIIDVAFSPRSENSWCIITDQFFFARNIPSSAYEQLKRLRRQKNLRVDRVIFDSNNPNRWIILHQNGFSSANLQADLLSQIRQYDKTSRKVHNVIFEPNGNGWAVFADDTFFMRSMPDGFFRQLSPLRSANLKIDVAALNPKSPQSSWVAHVNPMTDQRNVERAISTTESIWDVMESQFVPGVSIAVVQNNQLAWSAGYGHLKLNTPKRVTPETLFQAASISKPVTAVGLMRLVDSGQATLANTVSRSVRNWTLPVSSNLPQSLDPTLLQLATHSAGIVSGGYGGYSQGETLPTVIDTLNNERSLTNGRPVAAQVTYRPGTNASYSGQSYTLLQKAISDLSGQAFANYMQEDMLDPLGMTDSFFGPYIPEYVRPNVSSAHVNFAQANQPVDLRPVRGNLNVYPELAAAGLYTRPRDLARIIMMLNNRGMIDNRQYLRAASATAIYSIQHNFNVLSNSMGIGFRLGNTANRTRRVNSGNFYYHHGGTNLGIKCHMRGYPTIGCGVVVMTNSSATDISDRIASSIANYYGW